MKSNKKLLFSLMMCMVVVSIFMSSCGDKCSDVDCGANGSCAEGVCACNAGYEGNNCETTWAAKYASASTWAASDNITHTTSPTTTVGPYNYTLSITIVDPQTVVINNLSGLADNVQVTLNTATSFTISYTAPTKVYTGAGSIVGGGATIYTIHIYYMVDYGGGSYDIVNGTWVPN